MYSFTKVHKYEMTYCELDYVFVKVDDYSENVFLISQGSVEDCIDSFQKQYISLIQFRVKLLRCRKTIDGN